MDPIKSPRDLKTFEQLVQYKGHAYQEIYPDRFAILNHLFFVIGNGYEWQDGQLKAGHHEAKSIWYQDKKMDEQDFIDLLEKPDFVPKAVLLKSAPTLRGGEAYPLSDYSRINHLPDDVKDDWLAAAGEALEYLVKQDPKQRAQGLKIYAALQKRFADRGVLKPLPQVEPNADKGLAKSTKAGFLPTQALLSLAGRLLKIAKWPNVKSLAGHVLNLGRNKKNQKAPASDEMLSRAGYVLGFKRFVRAKSLAGFTLNEAKQHQQP